MGRIVFLLGLGVCASTILAQTPGTFTATGSMTTSRFFPTATLLADGRVLIAGGDLIRSASSLRNPVQRRALRSTLGYVYGDG